MEDARQLRILIVEDDLLIALDLEELLTEFGFDVCGTARTAAQAVSLARTRRPDLVLTDIQLADGSNGLDAAREVQDRFDIPSFILSSHADELREAGMPEAALGVLAKPYSPARLRSALVRAGELCQGAAA